MGDDEELDLFSEAYDEDEEAMRLAAHRATLPKGYVGRIAFLSFNDELLIISVGRNWIVRPSPH